VLLLFRAVGSSGSVAQQQLALLHAMPIYYELCGVRVSQRKGETAAWLGLPLCVGAIFFAAYTLWHARSPAFGGSGGRHVVERHTTIQRARHYSNSDELHDPDWDHGPAMKLETSIEVYANPGDPSPDGTSILGHTTYRLRLGLPPEARSVYAMYGDKVNKPHVPAAWMHELSPGSTTPPSSKLYKMKGFETLALTCAPTPRLRPHRFIKCSPQRRGVSHGPAQVLPVAGPRLRSGLQLRPSRQGVGALV
jgi:hypothetical protein